MKVVKAAAQVLNTLWQYRDLRTIYKKVRQRINCELKKRTLYALENSTHKYL